MQVDNNEATTVEEVDSAPAEPIEPDDNAETLGESDLGKYLEDDPKEETPKEEETPEPAPVDDEQPAEPPVEETPEPLDEAAQALLDEAKEWADQIDPELAEKSPELHKRMAEMKVGVDKLVAKNKDIAKGFDLYRQMDDALHSPEQAPVALASLVTYLTEKVGIERDVLLSELGVTGTPASVATTVDPDAYDFENPYERSKYAEDVQAAAAATTQQAIDKAMAAMRAQFEPVVNELKAAHEETVGKLQARDAQDAINRAIPVVVKKLAETYSGFQATPTEVREAQQANPQAFLKDPVQATASHLVTRLTAHTAQAAAKRTQPTEDLNQPDSRVGVVEKPIEERGLLDYVGSEPV